MFEEIQKVVETDINPQLALHGGACDVIDFEEGVLTIRLTGGCSGCPSSRMTLMNGIIPILRDRFDNIRSVVLE
jgi:Fe-S cluster biogenesis protein NfuA